MSKFLNARIQNKHDIEANWEKAVNFIPLAGEIIVYDPDETYTIARFKIGDGETLVNDLPFLSEDFATALEAERQARIAGDVQSNWNDNSASSLAHILNRPNISKGSGNKSIIIGEGEAIGDYSVAGGTNDKDLISDLAGGLASLIADINVSKAEGDMSLSFGAGTRSRTAGTVSLGALSNAGCKGFYFTAISGTTITLSNKQPSTLSSGAKWDANAQAQLSKWAKDDVLTIENNSTYTACCKIVSINNTSSAASIVVDKLPFTSKASNSLAPNFNEFSIINHNKPDAGVHQFGMGAMSIGLKNEAHGLFAKVEGRENNAFGNYSHAEGQLNKAGHCAHAEGRGNNAMGDYSHSEGFNTDANGIYSHSEGRGTTANGESSHAEGLSNIASGEASHAEGVNTNTSGKGAHAEGNNTDATGAYAHSEGYETTASGQYAHAEGHTATASGKSSHAEGGSTVASGGVSHAEGYNTKATEDYQHVQGKYNYLDENGSSGNYAHIVGGGTSNTNRKNIYTLDWDGNAVFNGNIEGKTITGTQSVINGTAKCIKLQATNLTVNKVAYSAMQFEITYDDGTTKTVKVLGAEV